MLRRAPTYLSYLLLALLAATAIADPKTGTSAGEEDALAAVNKQIAELEAKLKAIEHIKTYAGTANIGSLKDRDIEQTVAHFVKSTR